MLSPKKLKSDARVCLATAAYPPKKLAAIHSGIALGAGLLTTLLRFILERMMDQTGGLSGLGTRAILDTVATSAELIVSFLLPFWSIGFVYCALALARQDNVSCRDLTAGLRRFGVLLRHTLLQSLLYLLIGYLLLQSLSMVFLLSPLAAGAEGLLQSLTDPAAITEEMALSLLPTLAPLYIGWAVLFAAICLPLSYRLRLSVYRLLDTPRLHARVAMLESFRLMKGNCLSLFKLDLSFWWFYLLQALLSALLWAPELLTLAGVSLNSDVVYLASYGIYAGLTFLLYYTSLARVETTYGLFYLSLQPAPSPQPDNIQ